MKLFQRYPVLSLTLFGMLLMALVGAVGVVYFKSKPALNASYETVDLTGTWTAKGMSALIQPGTIEVDMTSPDSSALYWKGTFRTEPFKATLSDVEIHSEGDLSAMQASLFGSQDPTKTFVYRMGELTFKMTMLGTTQVIHLKKQ